MGNVIVKINLNMGLPSHLLKAIPYLEQIVSRNPVLGFRLLKQN